MAASSSSKRVAWRAVRSQVAMRRSRRARRQPAAWGEGEVAASARSKLDRSVGLILRCATAMDIEDNTFTDIDWYIYEIAGGNSFAGDVDGLTMHVTARSATTIHGRRPRSRL